MTEEDKLRVLTLWNMGFDTAEIARRLPITESRIANFVARLRGKTEPCNSYAMKLAEKRGRPFYSAIDPGSGLPKKPGSKGLTTPKAT